MDRGYIRKFAGKDMTLPQIVFTDPDWFWYMADKQVFTGTLAGEAKDIAAKAQRILIPGKSKKHWKVLSYLTPEGSFSHFDVFDAKADGDRRSAKTHSYLGEGGPMRRSIWWLKEGSTLSAARTRHRRASGSKMALWASGQN